METPTYTPPQEPMQQAPQAPKKGYGALIGLIVLVLLVVAAALFWPKEVQTPSATTQDTSSSEDFSSLEAELAATQFEGVSESL
jgi:hypothetical protein